MTQARAYGRQRSPGEALAELERCAPGQFDSACVAALRRAHAGTPFSARLDGEGLRHALHRLRPLAAAADARARGRAAPAGRRLPFLHPSPAGGLLWRGAPAA
ncbi:MAG: hypothetical protein ABR599_00880 [Gemmatimonadota bacterium]